jgi:hypothetical protein
MNYFQKAYYKIHDLLFMEVRKNMNLIKINSAFSRGSITAQLRKLDETNPLSWEFSAFSQNGEDGIIDYLIENLIESNRYFIEIGANNCIDNNTGWLAYGKNFSGLMIEGDSYIHKSSIDTKPWYTNYHNVFVSLENINKLDDLSLYKNPDFFSLDIDGNDFYLMKKILESGYRPKIVAVEYNSCFGPDANITVKYDKEFNFYKAHHTRLYYGVSISLWKKLFTNHGYQFITVESNGINAFFVDPSLFNSNFLKNIKGTEFKENVHQLRTFKQGWSYQFELIKEMDFFKEN